MTRLKEEFKVTLKKLLSKKRISVKELQILINTLKGNNNDFKKTIDILDREYSAGFLSEDELIMFMDALLDNFSNNADVITDIEDDIIKISNNQSIGNYNDLSQIKCKYGISPINFK